MGTSFIFEAALTSIFFFGCQSVTEDHNAMEAPDPTVQCVVSDVPRARQSALLRRQNNACISNALQHQNKYVVGDNSDSAINPVDITGVLFPTPFTGGGAVGVAQPGTYAPAVTLSANPTVVQAGSSSMLEWSGANIDSCVASAGWNGQRNAEGFESTQKLTQTTLYILTCNGQNGQITDSVEVQVTAAPAPTVSLQASPESINSGTSTTLTWTSENVDSCIALEGWSGIRPTSGSENSEILTETSVFKLTCSGPGGDAMDSVIVNVDGTPLPPASFSRFTVDEAQAPWGKNLGDVDGDGILDVMTGGGAQGPNVYWYRAPDYQKFQIGTLGGGDDLQSGDINGDGALDVVINRDPIGWYENPIGSGGDPTQPWTLHTIGNYRSHDIEVTHVNDDDKLDVVIRLDGNTSGTTRVFLQGSTPDEWTTIPLNNDSTGTGGLAVVDVDDDGRPDVIGDGYWLRQPATDVNNGNAWLRYAIGAWPAGSSIDTFDLNGDGNVDVTLAASEVGVGEFSWFEAPDDPLTQPWIRHVIRDDVEDVHRHHFVDFNQDGYMDIVYAEMHQSQTDRVAVLYNDGNADNWTHQILETHGSHNVAVGDIDNDGDIDILGANWAVNADGNIYLWINNTKLIQGVLTQRLPIPASSLEPVLEDFSVRVAIVWYRDHFHCACRRLNISPVTSRHYALSRNRHWSTVDL